jgi:hypothetical protein
MYTNEVRVVVSRWLHMTIPKVGATLCKLIRPSSAIRNSCLCETTLKSVSVHHVYMRSSPSRLTLLVIVRINYASTPIQLALFIRSRYLLKFCELTSYTYEVRLVNSRCLHETTLRTRRFFVYTLPARLVNSRSSFVREKLWQFTTYTYKVCLVNSRCLHETTYGWGNFRICFTGPPS